jgi:hypothetical protein
MDLGTLANWLQIAQAPAMIFAAWRWFRGTRKRDTPGKVAFGFCVLAAMGLFFVGVASLADHAGYFPHKLEVIKDRHFSSEVVKLDNRQFFDCTFENVTFEYRGGEYLLAGAKLLGAQHVTLQNKESVRSLGLLQTLNMIQLPTDTKLAPLAAE